MKETARLTLRGFRIWWQENPKMIIAPILCGVVDALSPYVNVWLLARLINGIAEQKNRQRLMALTLALMISTALFGLLSAALNRWKDVQLGDMWHVQNRIMNRKLLSMDFASVEEPHTQELRSQIWQNTDSGGLGLYKLLDCFDKIARAIASIVGGVALTFSLFILPVKRANLLLLNNPVFILLIAAVMVAVTLIVPFFSVKAGSYWNKFAEENKFGNRLFGFWLGSLGEDTAKAMDVRIYRQDILSRRHLEKYNPFIPTAKLPRAARGPMGGYQALSGAAAHIFTGASYLYVCLKALGGAYGVGSIVQYVSALMSLSGGVFMLLSTLGSLKNNIPFLCIVFEFLDIPTHMWQGNMHIQNKENQPIEIEFRNVSFKYPGQESYALRNVSTTIQTGRRLAVVGLNGSGKTTFIKLLCRLYEPTDGVIMLNGVDIRRIDYRECLSLFSVVFQDFKLLSFELGQNVASSVSYNTQKVEHCLLNAGFGEQINKLPKGLATPIYKDFEEDGVDVSGGEAQKIAIARALYKDAPFIILDEPTAALDPIAEHEIYARMDRMVGGKTAVFISHRLSSCRFCQDIAVFHEGQLVQRGRHDELVKEDGMYNELWMAQSKYYNTEQS